MKASLPSEVGGREVGGGCGGDDGEEGGGGGGGGAGGDDILMVVWLYGWICVIELFVVALAELVCGWFVCERERHHGVLPILSHFKMFDLTSPFTSSHSIRHAIGGLRMHGFRDPYSHIKIP